MSNMQVVHTVAELNAALAGRRGAFVPTMGALHEGHLALIRRAAELARPTVVSVFVNPTQFGPGEDFGRYPRMLDADIAGAAAAGAELVFAPDVATMYPPDEPVPGGSPVDASPVDAALVAVVSLVGVVVGPPDIVIASVVVGMPPVVASVSPEPSPPSPHAIEIAPSTIPTRSTRPRARVRSIQISRIGV